MTIKTEHKLEHLYVVLIYLGMLDSPWRVVKTFLGDMFGEEARNSRRFVDNFSRLP